MIVTDRTSSCFSVPLITVCLHWLVKPVQTSWQSCRFCSPTSIRHYWGCNARHLFCRLCERWIKSSHRYEKYFIFFFLRSSYFCEPKLNLWATFRRFRRPLIELDSRHWCTIVLSATSFSLLWNRCSEENKSTWLLTSENPELSSLCPSEVT